MKFFTLTTATLIISMLSIASAKAGKPVLAERKPGIVHEPAQTPQGENAHLYSYLMKGGDAAQDEQDDQR